MASLKSSQNFSVFNSAIVLIREHQSKLQKEQECPHFQFSFHTAHQLTNYQMFHEKYQKYHSVFSLENHNKLYCMHFFCQVFIYMLNKVEVVNTGSMKNSVRAHFLVPLDFGTCTLFPSSLLNQTVCQARNALFSYGAQEKNQKRHSPSAWLTHTLLLHPPIFAD